MTAVGSSAWGAITRAACSAGGKGAMNTVVVIPTLPGCTAARRYSVVFLPPAPTAQTIPRWAFSRSKMDSATAAPSFQRRSCTVCRSDYSQSAFSIRRPATLHPSSSVALGRDTEHRHRVSMARLKLVAETSREHGCIVEVLESGSELGISARIFNVVRA